MWESSSVAEGMLLDLLNTTPVIDGQARDELAHLAAGRRWLVEHGQPDDAGEWRTLLEARAALQGVIRGERGAAALAPFVDGVSYRAAAPDDDEGITWRLDLPEGRAAAARAVLTWDALRTSKPGRLRPCANAECRRFLIDHSKPNNARWCSMAGCGNRMKARRHYQRVRDAASQ
jgi:predicted RNA-binding Zn ribbon-like protein